MREIYGKTELNSSKTTEMNLSDNMSVPSKIRQIMHQEGLMFQIMTKLKGGISSTVSLGTRGDLGN